MKVFLCITVLFLSGCALLPEEDPALPPPALVLPQIRDFRTVEVVRGDVQRFTDVIALNVPVREEQLFFSVSGPVVLGIYVSAGDLVTEGEIVAELERPDIQVQLKNALREEEWALLNLSQLDARFEGGMESETGYQRERASLLVQLEIINIRLDYLRRQDENRFVRAAMDGVVTQALSFSYGMTADLENPVATIADQSQFLFRVSGENTEAMQPGDRFTLFFMREPFIAEVVERLGQEAFLVIIGDVPPAMGVTATATVQIMAEEALEAVAIPLTALRRTSLRTFVYVLEDGIRVDRDVDIGIIGTTWVEITGGLTVGERVVY
jgi:multidrug efflux pump subunit AcrA (membrane-fusion protein)